MLSIVLSPNVKTCRKVMNETGYLVLYVCLCMAYMLVRAPVCAIWISLPAAESAA